jgi:hypothetical protein
VVLPWTQSSLRLAEKLIGSTSSRMALDGITPRGIATGPDGEGVLGSNQAAASGRSIIMDRAPTLVFLGRGIARLASCDGDTSSIRLISDSGYLL